MTSYFGPLSAETGNVLALDMQSLFLTGRVLPFGAKLNITHRFRSSEKSPTEVVYCFPLPRDASLVSFEISGEGFSVSSLLEPRADAEKRYEEALEGGSLAGVTLQNLDGLVNLTVGNLRPGEMVSVRLELIAGVSIDDSGLRLRFPFTVAPCYHSLMRASLNSPGVGAIELPDGVTGGVFLPPFHRDASGLHKIGFDLQIEPKDGIREIASPFHALRVKLEQGKQVGVTLSPDRDVPNRDLILDVKRDWGAGQAWSDRPYAMRKHFSVVVPSSVFGKPTTTARRVVFLLDRSGSMEGTALNQARAAVEDCLAKLSAQDQFNIIAFSDRIERFRETMLAATNENVDEARAYLRAIDARGGTELASGVEAAAQALEGGTGQIFVITDGQVSETVEILRRVRKCEAQLFCLGIGSASQDRFLHLLARQTGGVCRFVTSSERIDDAASELFAAIGGALATEVRIGNANVQPTSAETVFSGTPFVAFGDIDVERAELELLWAERSQRLPFKALDTGLEDLIEKLRGAKEIADLEAHYDRWDPAAKQQLLQVSRRYGLASSEMSLVAVVKREGDRGGDVPKMKIVPVGMPGQTNFDSYFGNPGMLRGLRENVIMGRLSVESENSRIPSAAPSPLFDKMLPAVLAEARLSRPRSNLITVVREAIQTIENHADLRANKNANSRLDALLKKLVSAQDRVHNEAQKSALTALIDFLSADMVDLLETGRLDSKNWDLLRKQLEDAWPDLTKTQSSGSLTTRWRK